MKFVGKIHSTTYYIVKAHQWGKKKTNRKKNPINQNRNEPRAICVCVGAAK